MQGSHEPCGHPKGFVKIPPVLRSCPRSRKRSETRGSMPRSLNVRILAIWHRFTKNQSIFVRNWPTAFEDTLRLDDGCHRARTSISGTLKCRPVDLAGTHSPRAAIPEQRLSHPANQSMLLANPQSCPQPTMTSYMTTIDCSNDVQTTRQAKAMSNPANAIGIISS